MEPHRVYSLRARDVMNSHYALISPLANIHEAVLAMRQCGCQALIVDRVDEDDAYGILTYQEIVYRVINKSLLPTRVRVADVMIKPLIVVNPNLRLPYIAQLFANTGISHAPVIAEHRLAGLISLADLVEALVSEDPES
jgi:predicted transcriptional regulator